MILGSPRAILYPRRRRPGRQAWFDGRVHVGVVRCVSSRVAPTDSLRSRRPASFEEPGRGPDPCRRLGTNRSALDLGAVPTV